MSECNLPIYSLFPPPPSISGHGRKRKAKSGAEEARPSEGEVEEQEEKKAKEKARIDQLWASFKQDTAVPLHKPPENKGKVMSAVFLCSYPLPVVLCGAI